MSMRATTNHTCAGNWRWRCGSSGRGEQDEAEDWHAFLETVRDTKLLKQLHFAWVTHDVEVYQGCLWDDFPSEYKRWMAFRERKIENRLKIWLEGNGFSV
jgi:hypothetical protein